MKITNVGRIRRRLTKIQENGDSMANPQLEEGYTSIANEILCELCKISFNGTELKVIICIFRYTFGFHRKSHKLSASFIAKWINCDSRSVKRALKTLQEKKIIICINSDQRGVTSELMFNKDYEQWVTDDKAVTSDKVVTGDKVVPRPVTEPSPEPVTELSHKKRNKGNKNIKEKYYDDFFEKVWKAYPKKMGKSSVSKQAKKELYEAGETVVLEAIKSYVADIEKNGTETQYILYGSTFFNRRWHDYVREPERQVKIKLEEPAEKRIDLWSEE